MGADGRLDHLGRLEVRCRAGHGGELRRELAEHEVLAAALDEAERGGVPERGRAAVAEQHLVPVGQREQVARGPSRARRTTDRTVVAPVARAEVAPVPRPRGGRPPRGGPSTARSRTDRRKVADAGGGRCRRVADESTERLRRRFGAFRGDGRRLDRLAGRPVSSSYQARTLHPGPPRGHLRRAACPRARSGRAARRTRGRSPRARSRSRTSRARTSRRCGSRSGNRVNHFSMIPVPSITTPAAPRNTALSFWPGLNLPSRTLARRWRRNQRGRRGSSG